jgi:sodium-dependent dicarboxylate transporter 2/3/5
VDVTETEGDGYRPAQRIGLIAGPAAFVLLLLLPAPPGLGPEAWRTAAVAVLMAVWWMTEALPIPATALLPLALFPTLGVLPMDRAAAPYANELIFLFMGGFFLAAAMEEWRLHERIALSIVAGVGTSPERLVLGFMCATAFLSMWISNTATTAMMLPVALAMAEIFRPAGQGPGGGAGGGDAGPDTDRSERYAFGVALMLGVAYGASIGGVATLIGTPPNAVLAGAALELLDTQIGFGRWMLVGLPLAAFMIPGVWLLLVKVLHPPGEVSGDGDEVLERRRGELGAMGRGERIVATVFVLTALAWVFRAPKEIGAFTVPGIQSFAPGVRDATIAIAASVVLFLAPVRLRDGVFALGWERARTIPWGVLVLFGGGLSLARAMDDSGLAAWIGGAVAGLGGVPLPVLLLVTAALFVFLTEITSNTATSTMAMPVMAGAAAGLAVEPLSLMATAALASSMAFMLPVATPPNAIVFGSGYLTLPQMARAGFVLNLISILVVTAAGTFLLPLLFG